ncbi:hypothetical protein V8E55_008237 [Tylopilus felleus]
MVLAGGGGLVPDQGGAAVLAWMRTCLVEVADFATLVQWYTCGDTNKHGKCETTNANGSTRLQEHVSPQAFERTLKPSSHTPVVHDPNTNALYLWGGLARSHTNRRMESPALDIADAISWERLPAVNDDSDAAPVLKSYHASVIAGLYVHAGCPASGRLADLHAYDLATHTWHKLADAPAQPRGGTAIAALPAQSLSLSALEVSLAFNSPKISHPHTPSSDTWSTVYPVPDPEHGCPGLRSVHGLVPFTSGTQANTNVCACCAAVPR